MESPYSPPPQEPLQSGGARTPHDGRCPPGPRQNHERTLEHCSLDGYSASLPRPEMGSSGSALRVCADHRGGINWLSLSPDGQRLLTGSEDGTARLWSTADGRCCALLQGR